MSRKVIFITHAEVNIDPKVLITEWGLSTTGLERHQKFNKSDIISAVTTVYCSDEKKAIDGASILAEYRGLTPIIESSLHENDRSSTGYLPLQEFEKTVDSFFANPSVSIRGWEKAEDAQKRITLAVQQVIEKDSTNGDIAIIAHGGVGTLLMCYLLKKDISRDYDQPFNGGGSYFIFDADSYELLSGWENISA